MSQTIYEHKNQGKTLVSLGFLICAIAAVPIMDKRTPRSAIRIVCLGLSRCTASSRLVPARASSLANIKLGDHIHRSAQGTLVFDRRSSN